MSLCFPFHSRGASAAGLSVLLSPRPPSIIAARSPRAAAARLTCAAGVFCRGRPRPPSPCLGTPQGKNLCGARKARNFCLKKSKKFGLFRYGLQKWPESYTPRRGYKAGKGGRKTRNRRKTAKRNARAYARGRARVRGGGRAACAFRRKMHARRRKRLCLLREAVSLRREAGKPLPMK